MSSLPTIKRVTSTHSWSPDSKRSTSDIGIKQFDQTHLSVPVQTQAIGRQMHRNGL